MNPDSPEKVLKAPAGLERELVADCSAADRPQHGNKGLRHRAGECFSFSTLRSIEGDRSGLKIDSCHAQRSLSESAPGVQGDGEREAHPFFLMLKGLQAFRDLVVGELAFACGWFAADAKGADRVFPNVATTRGLMENLTQQLGLKNRRVAAAELVAGRGSRAKSDILRPVPVGDLGGVRDPRHADPVMDVTPVKTVGLQRPRRAAMTPQPALNPFPCVTSGRFFPVPTFAQRPLRPQHLGLRGLFVRFHAQPRRCSLLGPLLNVFEPPKRGVFSSVNASHMVCVTV